MVQETDNSGVPDYFKGSFGGHGIKVLGVTDVLGRLNIL